MAMLNVRLSEEDEAKLSQIAAASRSQSKSELIKRMINDQWIALQAGRTFVERRGGHPENLLQGSADLSSRKSRKVLVRNYDNRAGQRRRSRS